MQLFECSDYKSYIREKIRENTSTRGYQTQLAASAGCQPSVFSRVLRGDLHLSRDQAAELCRFWRFTADESEYFLGLLDLAKASSVHLKDMTVRRLRCLKEQDQTISKRLEKKAPKSREVEMTYYSAWYLGAVHIATSILGLQGAKQIADRFNLTLERVEEILRKLEKMGLVSQAEPGRWMIANRDVHLPASSPMTAVNHSNWRQKAIIDIQDNDLESLHYSSIFSMSRSDALLLRKNALDFILRTRKLVEPSPEEEVYCFCFDFFRP